MKFANLGTEESLRAAAHLAMVDWQMDTAQVVEDWYIFGDKTQPLRVALCSMGAPPGMSHIKQLQKELDQGGIVRSKKFDFTIDLATGTHLLIATKTSLPQAKETPPRTLKRATTLVSEVLDLLPACVNAWSV